MWSNYVVECSGRNDQHRRQRRDPAHHCLSCHRRPRRPTPPRHFLHGSQSVDDSYATPVSRIVIDYRPIFEKSGGDEKGARGRTLLRRPPPSCHRVLAWCCGVRSSRYSRWLRFRRSPARSPPHKMPNNSHLVVNSTGSPTENDNA